MVSAVVVNGLIINLNYDYTIIDNAIKFTDDAYLEVSSIITILYSTEYTPLNNVNSLAVQSANILSGMINIPSNSFTCDILFDQMFVDNYLAFISINSSNNDNPINYIITNKTKSGFTVKFESEILTNTYSIDWIVKQK